MVQKAEFYVFNNRSYVDFYPIQFGMEACEPLHSFGPTMKQHYLFHYVISGSGTFYSTGEERCFPVKAGQGFLISPNMICSYEADFKDPWTYIWIEFDGLKAEHFIKQAGLSSKQPIFTQKKAALESPVYQEMRAILDFNNNRSSLLLGHLYLFIFHLIEESMEQKSISHEDIKDFYIREGINFVERNYHLPIGVEDMAKRCNLNKHYFSRLFKKEMNISPQQFIIQYRLSEACELLKNTTLSLQEIAESVGYSNQFNFSNAFKRQFHQSPSQWRKQNR
ncbi:AraC family transcriptional regulator [Streptococcus ovis]|uniref:AraC family transcriptional regulator n=1 Tax=Streptococcus ovis TaxID=82806 RepID=UPI000375BF59|nr:AraC family transcriptional regulator [Streptococcus ovis]